MQALRLLHRLDLHVHFPAAATPKDGPSAGITIATALVSLMSGICPRGDTAMTGELSLLGLVLPVGGIKSKVLGAHRHGIRRLILPLKNKKDIEEVPKDVASELEIHFAEYVVFGLTFIIIITYSTRITLLNSTLTRITKIIQNNYSYQLTHTTFIRIRIY